jgi:hypothetical protein
MIAYACSRVSIAASTFGGEIGSSVSRRPTGYLACVHLRAAN